MSLRNSLPALPALPALPGLSQPRSVALTAAAATASAIGLYQVISYGVAAYRGWRALGPGGPPYNLFGWLAQSSLQLITPRAQKLRDASVYADHRLDAHYGPLARVSFLGTPGPDGNDGPDATKLPPRAGQPPPVPGYVAPQRQTAERASPAMKERMNAYLHEVVAANAELLETRPSELEGRTSDAAWLRDTSDVPRALVRVSAGEIFHVHPPDGSSHVTLSLADAEEVMRKGWAQRHKTSGVVGLMPLSFVMVYAPRNDAEFDVWKRIMLAGLRFIAGGRQIKSP